MRELWIKKNLKRMRDLRDLAVGCPFPPCILLIGGKMVIHTPSGGKDMDLSYMTGRARPLSSLISKIVFQHDRRVLFLQCSPNSCLRQ
jgi:hypothetical protein